MRSEIAANSPSNPLDYTIDPARGWVARTWSRVPLGWRLSGTALLGALGAAAVGHLSSGNPTAAPAHLAVEIRVAIIATLIGAGLYAQTSRIQERMGGLLVVVGLFSCLWLLNGARDPVLFSVGAVCAGAMPLLAAYVMLAHPTGHLHSRAEQRLLWIAGGTMTMLWVLAILMTLQPPLRTPLLQCAPRCQNNVFSLGSAVDTVGVVRVALIAAWVALIGGTALLLCRRVRSASAPLRRSLGPVCLVAVASLVLLVVYLPLNAAGAGFRVPVGAAYLAVGVMTPIGILVGLTRERLFMGQALAEFVDELARLPGADPEAMMAAALRDPTLRICYARSGGAGYVDSAGSAVNDLPAERAVTWIERQDRPVAAVLYSPDLRDQERFVHAAGAAALIRLEKIQLEADLTASTADLASSRIRLVETADAERRRLERDLHDGAQQHLVSLRIKLEMAAETLKEDRARGERALASVGKEMDEVLHELRLLARGIYPSVLGEHGLREALKAAARSSTVPVEVHAAVSRRYPEDVEVAVYFCCLEALQNVVKHAGPHASAKVRLWEDGSRLNFEIRSSGVGFDPEHVGPGSGLVNMRDRVEAVGGTLIIVATEARGVSVRGNVPAT